MTEAQKSVWTWKRFLIALGINVSMIALILLEIYLIVTYFPASAPGVGYNNVVGLLLTVVVTTPTALFGVWLIGKVCPGYCEPRD
jgi:hypothetical protein